MQRDEIVYVPKYPLTLRIALILSPVMIAMIVWFLLAEGFKDPRAYLALLFVLAIPFLPLRIYRRIRFGTEIVCERFLLPPRRIVYTSIVDVDTGTLKTRQGRISVANCENWAEFDAAVEESRKRGYWSEVQIEGKIAGQQVASWMTIAIGMPVAAVATFVAILTEPFGLRLPWFAWYFGTYLPLAAILYAYLRRRSG